jgi:ATP-dependent DNA helicase RecQ
VAPPAALLSARRATAPQPDHVLSALHRWRAHRAVAFRVAPGAVLADEVLERVAHARPSTVPELAAIEGIGRARAASIGPGLLAALSSIAA